jgi:drug/metabolite transporter (DMT)-like permease
MNLPGLRNRGVQAALASAALFGVGTPLAKGLLDDISPWMLAGLLYAGSGLGLILVLLVRRTPRPRLKRNERLPLVGAIASGGIVAPVLLMVGLANMPASGASLLLNAEAVFTTVLAWWVFNENWDRRVALGFIAIVAGAAVLSIPGSDSPGAVWPSLVVLGACLAWGVDNNLTRKVSGNDATWLAAIKGSVAGPVNLGIALLLGAHLPPVRPLAAALGVGFLTYGVSLVLFVIALRQLGTARSGAYFSVAPFFGTIVAVGLGDAVTVPLMVAGVLMTLGVAIHLTERHDHVHAHGPTAPFEWHLHSDDATRAHGAHTPADGGHRHNEVHESLVHGHPHYPGIAHRHPH